MKFLFSNPQFLSLLPLLILPIILHFLKKEKSFQIFFSNISLLKELQRKKSLNWKLQNLLLLLLRILFLLLFLLGLAGTTLTNKYFLAEEKIILIIDNSQSMGLKINKHSNLQLALQKAQQILKNKKQSQVCVMETSPQIKFITKFLPADKAIKYLSKIKQSSAEANLDIALMSAVQKLNLNSGTIYLFSDLQKSNFLSKIKLPDNISLKVFALKNKFYPNIYFSDIKLFPPWSVIGKSKKIIFKLRSNLKVKKPVMVIINLRDLSSNYSTQHNLFFKGNLTDSFILNLQKSGKTNLEISFITNINNEYTPDNKININLNVLNKINVALQNTTDLKYVSLALSNKVSPNFKVESFNNISLNKVLILSGNQNNLQNILKISSPLTAIFFLKTSTRTTTKSNIAFIDYSHPALSIFAEKPDIFNLVYFISKEDINIKGKTLIALDNSISLLKEINLPDKNILIVNFLPLPFFTNFTKQNFFPAFIQQLIFYMQQDNLKIISENYYNQIENNFTFLNIKNLKNVITAKTISELSSPTPVLWFPLKNIILILTILIFILETKLSFNFSQNTNIKLANSFLRTVILIIIITVFLPLLTKSQKKVTKTSSLVTINDGNNLKNNKQLNFSKTNLASTLKTLNDNYLKLYPLTLFLNNLHPQDLNNKVLQNLYKLQTKKVNIFYTLQNKIISSEIINIFYPRKVKLNSQVKIKVVTTKVNKNYFLKINFENKTYSHSIPAKKDFSFVSFNLIPHKLGLDTGLISLIKKDVNNQLIIENIPFSIFVEKDKYKALVFQGYPHIEFTFLKEFLFQFKNIESKFLVFKNNSDFYPQLNYFKFSKILSLNNILSQLNNYDLIIIANCNQQQINNLNKAIKKYLREGKSLILWGGENFINTNLFELANNFTVKENSLQLLSYRLNNFKISAKDYYPILYNYFNFYSFLKLQHLLIAEDFNSKEKVNLISTANLNKSKISFVATLSLYKLCFNEENKESCSFYNQMLNSFFTYMLSMNNKNKSLFFSQKDKYFLGEPLTLILDLEKPVANQKSFAVEVTINNKPINNLKLEEDKKIVNRFIGFYIPEKEGNYKFKIKNIKPLDLISDTAKVKVNKENFNYINTDLSLIIKANLMKKYNHQELKQALNKKIVFKETNYSSFPQNLLYYILFFILAQSIFLLVKQKE